ncbi:hypothetical protein Ciccas_000922 [Cichlidogyrus casuarinus]|uniref:Uncharacterized protein n=1 Tax=Cichlidogyrus casuarinus TaxID=1844966 RepID=A0ABD2QLI5_9PLAT
MEQLFVTKKERGAHKSPENNLKNGAEVNTIGLKTIFSNTSKIEQLIADISLLRDTLKVDEFAQYESEEKTNDTQSRPNIIERITIRRKQKHEQAVSEWENQLENINKNIDARASEVSDNYSSELDTLWVQSNGVLNQMKDPEKYTDISYQQFEANWSQLDSISNTKRRPIISSLFQELMTFENERITKFDQLKIRTIFSIQANYLRVNSHLNPEQLKFFLAKQILVGYAISNYPDSFKCANVQLLANQRTIVELCANLEQMEVLGHRKMRLTFEFYYEKWREINRVNCINSFS